MNVGNGNKGKEPGRDVDAFDLARKGGVLEGSIALPRLLRLVDGLPEQSGMVSWSVRGDVGQGTGKTGVIGGQPLLHLRVKADLRLACQRCNALFSLPVDSRVTLQLVESEEDLDDDLGILGDDDDDEGFSEEDFAAYPDKVVGSRHFDLLAQVEDELILNVPYVPRHEVCPGMQASPAGDAPQEPAFKRPSPFAVLEQLKRKD